MWFYREKKLFVFVYEDKLDTLLPKKQKKNLILVTCEADMCDAQNQMCIYRRVIMHDALPSVESKTHTKVPT